MSAPLSERSEDAECEARAWIEAVLKITLEGTLQEALKSGVVLCALLNTLKPGSVKAPSKSSKPFMQMSNVSSYLT